MGWTWAWSMGTGIRIIGMGIWIWIIGMAVRRAVDTIPEHFASSLFFRVLTYMAPCFQ